MIVGASYYDQGTSRAQVHLRKILDAPGVNAYTLPGNEFLLGKLKKLLMLMEISRMKELLISLKHAWTTL